MLNGSRIILYDIVWYYCNIAPKQHDHNNLVYSLTHLTRPMWYSWPRAVLKRVTMHVQSPSLTPLQTNRHCNAEWLVKVMQRERERERERKRGYPSTSMHLWCTSGGACHCCATSLCKKSLNVHWKSPPALGRGDATRLEQYGNLFSLTWSRHNNYKFFWNYTNIYHLI